ncbi:MAG: hypothetical protein AAB601_00905 [Patescibacteria group bacterium]
MKDPTTLSKQDLSDSDVIESMSSGQLSRLSDVELERKVTVKTVLESRIVDASGNNVLTDIIQYRKRIDDLQSDLDKAKDLGDVTEIRTALSRLDTAKDDLKNTMDSMDERAKAVLRNRDLLADNLAWQDTFPEGSGKPKKP